MSDLPRHRLRSTAGRGAAAILAAGVLISCSATPAPSPPVPPPPKTHVFPLGVSTDSRYLVDANDRPFFMVGGSPQLIAHLSLADAETYLAARDRQGFNAVQIYSLPWSFGNCRALPGGNGAYPFTAKLGGGTYAGDCGTADFSTPNDNYFQYLDQILAAASSHGFYIHLYALDYGYGGDGQQGWWLDVKGNPVQALQSFGTYLGGRYKGLKNVAWVDGSDYFPSSSEAVHQQNVLAFVQAMRDAGATQLRTGDWAAPSLSTDEPLFAGLMQLNGIYSYGGLFPGGSPNTVSTYPQSRAGWNYTPPLPAYLKETAYERSTFAPGDPASLRKGELWSVLSGGTAGFFYEHEDVLHMTPGWQTQYLGSRGAEDAGRIGALFQSYAWWKLVPSELSGMRRLVVSPNGSQAAAPDDYVAAAQASDGTFMFAYVPPHGSGSQSLTIDFRSMAGSARARWWDPTDGGYTDITGGAYSIANTTSALDLSTPGENNAGDNDWILVVDTQ